MARIIDGEKKNLIGSAPMLQNGAADSISIVFEVTADAIGYVDISTSPDMKNAVRHFSGSRGLVELNDKIARILVSNLKPAVLCGVESHGMILAADADENDVRVIFVDDLPVGAK